MHRLLVFTLLMSVASSSPSSAAEGRPPEGSPADFSDGSPAFVPVADLPGLPKVLLIGDSISVGYTIGVRERLAGRANVHRIPENAGPTSRGVEKIENWLGDGDWDVIHFNWGLHDIKYMDDGKRQVSEQDYAANLRLLVSRLQRTGATLIWCTTTPVPPGEVNPPRQSADVPAYNAIAAAIMKERGIAIHDLHAFVLPRLEQLQIPVNVHFTEAGSAALAERVAGCIGDVLGKGD